MGLIRNAQLLIKNAQLARDARAFEQRWGHSGAEEERERLELEQEVRQARQGSSSTRTTRA